MGSLVNPRPWVPYMNTKDCSQGFCSIYCPQWCYILFPPPPPIEFPDTNSGPNFSPLVIAIISILASAFLLVSYYAIISKYCGNTGSSRRENRDPNEELEESNNNPSNHEPCLVATTGLDEAVIKSITVCKYKKGDGLIEGTDCSVCLSEFEEDESLRLLPKCSHAFHVTCIDTWLKSQSSCPLCRANVVSINASPSPFISVIEAAPLNNESLSDNHLDNSIVAEDPLRAVIELGSSEEQDTIIEIREEIDQLQPIRRSVSMDYLCQRQLSIADVLQLEEEHEFQVEDCYLEGDVGSSKRSAVEMNKSCHRNKDLHCVMSPVAMKRSISSGRFSFSRRVREQNIMLPL